SSRSSSTAPSCFCAVARFMLGPRLLVSCCEVPRCRLAVFGCPAPRTLPPRPAGQSALSPLSGGPAMLSCCRLAGRQSRCERYRRGPTFAGRHTPGRGAVAEISRTSYHLVRDAEAIAAGRARWQRRYDAATTRVARPAGSGPAPGEPRTTVSGLEVEPVYGPGTGHPVEGFERIGWPGEF